MSARLDRSLPFRFMRWKFGLEGLDADTESVLRDRLLTTLDQTPELDAAVVLAFDAVHAPDGQADWANTHLYVTNDYVINLAAGHRKVLFGASVHPYREDAVAELERCIAAGAVLVKWLPITQNFNPGDERCFGFYEAMAHHGITLLCHTGGETSLPQLDRATADPMLLVPALQRGVKVIMAHCGTRSRPDDVDYLDSFVRLCHEYEHAYGDTSALNLPMRWCAYDAIFADEVVRSKLVHGSDWPILPIPPVRRLGLGESLELMAEENWLRRDILIKHRLGFDHAYWHRAGEVLGVRE